MHVVRVSTGADIGSPFPDLEPFSVMQFRRAVKQHRTAQSYLIGDLFAPFGYETFGIRNGFYLI